MLSTIRVLGDRAIRDETTHRAASARDELEGIRVGVARLVDERHRLFEQNAALRDDIRQGQKRVDTLEAEVRELNQKKRDIAKRIDELIGHLDRLEAQNDTAETTSAQ